MHRPPLSVLVLLGTLILLLWLAPEVPLLGFSGLLMAIALRALAEPLVERLRLPDVAAVLLVAAVVIGLLGFGIWTAAGPLAEQARQLAQDLPRSLSALQDRVATLPGGGELLERLEPSRLMGEGGGGEQAAAMATRTATNTLGALGNLLLVVLLALYLAVDPRGYRRGLVALFAPEIRREAVSTIAETEKVLRGWLLGQAFAMVVSGVLTYAGLWALGVPLAGVLAVIAAVLGFIPIIGPVIAAVPAVLLALASDPWSALWVAGLFLAVQNIEGNLLTPMVQSKAADLPPALLLVAQLLMGALFGLLGVTLAAPAAAAALVMVRRGYVEDVLEAKAEERTTPAPRAPERV